MAQPTTPKVSVIFTIYNNERYLKRCIQSVMDQSLHDIEMILIDDGSTDNSPAICDDMALKDSRIRVIHKKNEGSAAGRNQGIDLAIGEYIAFVESDDYVATDMYEKLYHLAIDTFADIVKCGFYYCEGNKQTEEKSFYSLAKEGNSFKAVDKPEIFLYHSSMWAGIYKREFINHHNIRCIVTPSATYSDFSWMAMTYAYADKIVILHKAFYYYTYDNPNSSRIQEGNKCFYKPYHCLEANRILRQAGIFDQVKEEIGSQEYRTCFGHARRVRAGFREEYFSRFRKVIKDLCKNGFKFKRFFFWEKSYAKLLLNNDSNKFYRRVEVYNRISDSKIFNRIKWSARRLKYLALRRSKRNTYEGVA